MLVHVTYEAVISTCEVGQTVVILVRDIPAFVMYCVSGESHSFVLIESTDSIFATRLSHV